MTKKKIFTSEDEKKNGQFIIVYTDDSIFIGDYDETMDRLNTGWSSISLIDAVYKIDHKCNIKLTI